MICEKCLYRKNCQFLLKHKKTVVEGCGVFKCENEIIAEAIKEFAERLKKEAYLTDHRVYAVLRDDIDNLVKEMVGE